MGYHLETITARNQTRDFEIFCRKLCERIICPNLKPATGPEGGGDIGEANAGQERWAFALRRASFA